MFGRAGNPPVTGANLPVEGSRGFDGRGLLGDRGGSKVAYRLVVDERTDTLLDQLPELLAEVIAEASPEERSDQGLLTERVRIELQRLFRKQVGRRPLVLPVIMEI